MIKISLEICKDRIEDLYKNEKLSLAKIARKMKLSAGTIRKNMILWGIDRRTTRKRRLIKPAKEELEKVYYDKNKSVNEILVKFDVGLTTLFRWLKEYRINPSRRFRYEKKDFSEDVKEKAYILGLVAGDIHVRRHCKQILAELTTTHPAMMNLFYSVFDKYGTPKKYIKYNKTTKRYEWKAYVLLNDTFNFMLLKDNNIDNEYFYHFLAGFFDCEGCLYVYDNHHYVGLSSLIYNSNKELLEIIKKRLEKDSYNPKLSKFFKKGEKTTNNYYRGKDIWAIRLHTTKEVLSLMNLMPIKHKEKLDKLEIVSKNSNKWEDISNQINDLKASIKEGVKEYIIPRV